MWDHTSICANLCLILGGGKGEDKKDSVKSSACAALERPLYTSARTTGVTLGSHSNSLLQDGLSWILEITSFEI